MIIDAEQTSREGGDLSEADEQRFVDLPFGLNERAAEEKDKPAYGKDGCRDEL
jgi:hypothetical protein